MSGLDNLIYLTYLFNLPKTEDRILGQYGLFIESLSGAFRNPSLEVFDDLNPNLTSGGNEVVEQMKPVSDFINDTYKFWNKIKHDGNSPLSVDLWNALEDNRVKVSIDAGTGSTYLVQKRQLVYKLSDGRTLRNNPEIKIEKHFYSWLPMQFL